MLPLILSSLYPHSSDANLARGTLKHALLCYILFTGIGDWNGPSDITNLFFGLQVVLVAGKLSSACYISNPQIIEVSIVKFVCTKQQI